MIRFPNQRRDTGAPYPDVIAVHATAVDVSGITDVHLLQEQRMIQHIEFVRQTKKEDLVDDKHRTVHKPKLNKSHRRKPEPEQPAPFLSIWNIVLLILLGILLALIAFVVTFCVVGSSCQLASVFSSPSTGNDQSANTSNGSNDDTLNQPPPSVPAVVEFIQSLFATTTRQPPLQYPPRVGASPEELALASLVKHDRKFPLPASAHRVMQRFVLRTLYFQQLKTGGGLGSQQAGEHHYGWSNLGALIDECTWDHVVCDSQSNVKELQLESVGLKGNLPETLGWLSGLQYASFADNALVGTIPESLGACSQLTHLALQSNQLTGTIPTSLWALPLLEDVMVYQNSLEGSVPPDVSTRISVAADCDEVDCPSCVTCCGEGEDC